MIHYLQRYWSFACNQKYGQHLVFEKAITKNTISQKQTLVFSFVGGVCGFLIFVMSGLFDQGNILQYFKGITISLYIYLIFTYVAGIILFRYVINHPDEMSGVTHIKRSLVPLIEITAILPIAAVLMALSIFVPDPFIIGSVIVFDFLCICSIVKFLTIRERKS